MKRALKALSVAITDSLVLNVIWLARGDKVHYQMFDAQKHMVQILCDKEDQFI